VRPRIYRILLPLALILGCAAWAADEAADVAGLGRFSGRVDRDRSKGR